MSERNVQRFEKNMRDFETSMHEFIRVEIQTGLAFADTALSNPSHRLEDRAKARLAYDTALRFIGEAGERFPDHAIAQASLEGMKKLKGMLEELGERL